MNKNLTKREHQVAEFIAWGASKKEVPELLQKKYGGKEISVHTVENILRNIFEKLHFNKSTELSAWWFCHKYGISEDESPIRQLKKNLIACFLLMLLIPQIIGADMDALRPNRARTSTRVERVQRARRSRSRKDEYTLI